MTRDNQTDGEGLPNLSYDWNLLGNARVAAQYLSQGKEGLAFARKSLELILQDAEIQDPWIISTVTDPEVVRKTIRSQLETYEQFRGEQTVQDLTERYEGKLSDLLEDEAETALSELGEFSGRKYGEILKEIDTLDYVIEGKKYDRSTYEEVETAKEQKERYEKVNHTIELLEGLSSMNFRTRVEEAVTKDALREMYSPTGEE